MIDALAYEWKRLTTIRSTYWLFGLALVVQTVVALFIGWALSASSEFTAFDDAFGWVSTTGASIGGPPLAVAYLCGLLGVLAMGHEYRYGTIRSTLTALPSRPAVFAAKALTVGLAGGLVGLFCVVSAVATFALFGLDMPSGEAFRQVSIGLLIYCVLFSLWGLAITTLVRNQTVAVGIMLLVPTVLEFMVRWALVIAKAVGGNPQEHGGLITLSKFLPFDAGSRMYIQTSIGDLLGNLGVEPFGPVGGGAVMGTFVGVMLLWALAAFLGRDA